MPVFDQEAVLKAARNIRSFFVLRLGAGRGETAPVAGNAASDGLREQLAAKDREISRLRARLSGETAGIRPENIVWIFGVARTGSSWLGAMMSDLDDHAMWNEPYVGDVFGYAYFMRAGDQMRKREDFVLSDRHRDTWTGSLRTFFLEGANARFPGHSEDGYLVVKEPNGSVGAPLLMEAFPESRVILLVRDPRDVVASLLAANKKGSWGAEGSGGSSLADEDPDEFVRLRAKMYVASLGKAKEAYDAHGGRKVVVRYEDLRYDTLGELEKVYATLGIPVPHERLREVVQEHAWENVPDGRKGATKPRRKAKPGGWREDLTPEQARTVEEITTPLMRAFYPG